MSAKSFLCVLLALCLVGCSAKKTVMARKAPKPISTHRLSEIRTVERVDTSARGSAHWIEDGHPYVINLAHLTLRYLASRPPVLSGSQTLQYDKGRWAKYMNERLGSIGIRVDKIILSIPGHLVVFRGFTPLERERVVDCLIHPNASKGGRGVSYTSPGFFATENMAVRELHESPDEDQILIVDHLRDRNRDGDLGIAYILQDINKEMKQYSFFGHIDHRHLFDNRCLTYQYIERVLSPITVSLLPSCRFQEFSPRGDTEVIPKHFLSE